MYEESVRLTKEMVGIPSVNGTAGEKDIATYIEHYLRGIPYFQAHPDFVFTRTLHNDVLGRKNVFALLKGEKPNEGKTILFHGHTDTVDTKDFGALEPYAFDCQALEEQLRAMALTPEVAEDLASGAYLFGRGACDMKSGNAVYLAVLHDLSKHPETLAGNVLFMFNPVEENLHTGMMEALPVLEALQKEQGLQYLFAVNNDYTCPLFPGDHTRFVYAGAAGKLLPCFYIQGKETHVGQCFEGFDATMVAAELIREMNLNTRFCDGYQGEYTLPPQVLYAREQKAFYDVQTPQSAFVYFNYYVHTASVEDILQQLKTLARGALERVQETINQRYQAYCKLCGMTYTKLSYPLQVLTYEELVWLAKQQEGQADQILEALSHTLLAKGTDKREIGMHLTRKLCQLANIKTPLIVLFFAAPYCPQNTLKQTVPKEKQLWDQLSHMVKAFEKETGEAYRMLHFYPSLSDSSYLKLDDDHLETLLNNFPQYQTVYPVPFRQIKRMNIPALTFGVYGKDAHKWTERVYRPYTFGVLPKLILKTIETFL